jgi:protein CpxP
MRHNTSYPKFTRRLKLAQLAGPSKRIEDCAVFHNPISRMEGAKSMSTKGTAGESNGETIAIQKWRKGKLLCKEDLCIGFLMLSVAVVIFLIAARIQFANPAPQGERERRLRPPSADQRLERLSRVLNLDDQQKTKIRPILEEENKQMEALRTDSSLTPEDRRAKFREIHENAMKQMNPLLTPEQQEKLARMRKRRMERRGGPPRED